MLYRIFGLILPTTLDFLKQEIERLSSDEQHELARFIVGAPAEEAIQHLDVPHAEQPTDSDYVLMPREATREMTIAACDFLPSCEHVFGHAGEILRKAYQRMVEVAGRPSQPETARAADEIEELEQLFDLRWKADMRAIKRWQEATGRTTTWPDHADLVVWLMEQLPS